MIEYDREAWWGTAFAVGGTVLPRVLGRVGLLTAVALALSLLDEYVLARSGAAVPALDPLGHTVLGVAVGLLVVFRTNTAYARFWEARSHWGGIVNASRNLARGCAAMAGPADEVGRLLAAYVEVLKASLRGTKEFGPARSYLPAVLADRLPTAVDPPGVVARGLSDWVAARLAAGKLPPPQAEALERLVGLLVDYQGGSEKIKKTPLPFAYAALTRLVLLVYLGTLPFVLVAKMGFAAPLAVAVVALGLFGIEEAGAEVEAPFSSGPNALPLDAICRTVVTNALEATDPNRG